MSPPITLTWPPRKCCSAHLNEFGGTILLVSHDRYLVDAVATQIWEVEPAEQESLMVFPGTYSEYKRSEMKEAEQKLKRRACQQKDHNRLPAPKM